MNKVKQNQKGFTLIELLVVIAIIGLLASVVLLALNSARQRSRDAKRLADARQISSALELYNNDAGGYPSTTASLTSTTNPGGVTYIGLWPTYPTPIDTPCTSGNSSYAYVPTGATNSNGSYANYVLTFCLGATTGGYGSGTRTATPAGIQ